MTDSVVTRQHSRTLAIIDDYSRVCPAIKVDTLLVVPMKSGIAPSPAGLTPKEFAAVNGDSHSRWQ